MNLLCVRPFSKIMFTEIMLTSCFLVLFGLPLRDSAALNFGFATLVLFYRLQIMIRRQPFVFATLTLFYILLEKKRHIWDTQVLYYIILYYLGCPKCGKFFSGFFLGKKMGNI